MLGYSALLAAAVVVLALLAGGRAGVLLARPHEGVASFQLVAQDKSGSNYMYGKSFGAASGLGHLSSSSLSGGGDGAAHQKQEEGEEPQYVDEEDKTEEEEDYVWSSEELDMIKNKILDGLNLSSVPTRAMANVTQEEYEEARRLYEEAVRLEAELHPTPPEEDDEDEDEEEEEEDDDFDVTVMPNGTSQLRFFGKMSTVRRRGRGRRSVGAGQIVHFRVSVPVRQVYGSDISVVHANCRVWKSGIASSAAASSNLENATVAVSFYELNSKSRRRPKRGSEPTLLQTVNASVVGDEWLTLEVTEAVRRWINAPRGEASVLVQCPDCASAGVTIYTGSRASNTSLIPTLDVQTKVLAQHRVKRSKQLSRATKAKIRKKSDCRDRVSKRGRQSKRCCRKSMKVKFSDLPNFDFIESPKEFDAYYCSGRCPPRYNPANEHALLQSLLNRRNKNSIPRPCCAPTALKGLPIIHLTEKGKITVTHWRDVIVTACGCA